MASYRTRFSRRASRWSRRRARGALSTKRIFSKTSAKSQAAQIYALRKRVAKINAKLKPDIKVISGVPKSTEFTSNALSNIWDGFGVLQPAEGYANNERVGDKIYEKALSVQMYAEYYNSSNTGYHDSESSGCTVRVFVVQHKTKGDPLSTYDLSTFLDNPSTTGANYSILPVKPFAENVTQDWKILYNKVFTMTAMRNQKLLKFTLRPGTLRFDSSGNHNFIKVYTVVSGLHYDQNFTEYVNTTVNCKLVYTDL